MAATVTVSASSSPKACADRAYELTGVRHTKTLKWSFHSASTPRGLEATAATSTIRRAFSNIVNARNNCGRSDQVDATAYYLGTTSQAPSCMAMDGRNVVGFQRLAKTTLAQTCWWSSEGRVTEVDIQINSALPWATSLASCRNAYMLEAVMTHEVGHAFGVGHVAEDGHGRLTMSTNNDGMCVNREAKLGLGDLLALEALY